MPSFIPTFGGISDANKIKSPLNLGWALVFIIAIMMCVLQIVIFVNHLSYPDLSRGAVFEAVSRLNRGLLLFPAPSSEYVAQVHTPLYPLISSIFTKLFGSNAASLRLLALLGACGAWLVVYLAISEQTKSRLFGLIGAGLFAGAYLAFDGYVDYANPDSWLLFCGLLGTYFIWKRQGIWTPLGILVLILGYWFKQHGAFFIVGGLTYITFRDGIRKSLWMWILFILLVPVMFLFIAPLIFGDHFLYFTYIVPRAWSILDRSAITRYLLYMVQHWTILGAISAVVSIWSYFRFLRYRELPNIWFWSLPFALVTGVLGTLDPGSENNQYLSSGTWFIIISMIVLAAYLQSNQSAVAASKRLSNLYERLYPHRQILVLGILLISFAINIFNPQDALMPARSWDDYNYLVEVIKSNQGIVYMPDVVQLPQGFRLPMPVAGVQLEDIARVPGRDYSNDPIYREVLAPLVTPTQDTYIFIAVPLENIGIMHFLTEDYVLVHDFGDQFESLKGTPGRYTRLWPRYLYANKGNHGTPTIPPLKS